MPGIIYQLVENDLFPISVSGYIREQRSALGTKRTLTSPMSALSERWTYRITFITD